jgi:hypothetical protein
LLELRRLRSVNVTNHFKPQQKQQQTNQRKLPSELRNRLPSMSIEEKDKYINALERKERLASYASEVKLNHKPKKSVEKANEL